MRPLIVPLLMLATACATSATPEGPPPPQSVRERLAQPAPTKLLVTATASSGAITARRYDNGGWDEGTTPIAIDNGELDLHLAADGELQLDNFAVAAAPNDIPPSVFGKPAQLRDVRLVLAAPPAVTTTWSDDDHATATASLDLDLSWTFVIDNAATPLGTQHLHGIPVQLALTGSGDQVDAAISADATGTLWSWADLVQLTQLELTLHATTAF